MRINRKESCEEADRNNATLKQFLILLQPYSLKQF